MKKQKRDNWALGFLGFLSIRAIPAILVGDWINAFWIVWVVWFIYFIPVPKTK